MKEIDKSFLVDSRSIYTHFQRPGFGFYIPLYQREYSWDKENIDQFCEDLEKGIIALADKDEEEIRFLGTIIIVNEKDKNKVQPQDPQALPTAIESVIDGQQRLSTISLFASRLYDKLLFLESKIDERRGIEDYAEWKDELIAHSESNWRDKLQELFALNLKRGNPSLKPKLIRGQVDKWVRDGGEGYESPLSSYLHYFIDHVQKQKQLESQNKLHKYQPAKSFGTADKSNISKNISSIDRWIERISQAHLPQKSRQDIDPPLKAWEILAEVDETYIWEYPRPELKNFILSLAEQEIRPNSPESDFCAFVQLFTVCYYFLERCCFTVIEPANEKWAFDMFQSLNATGTPLTAIETFKPLVVNTVNKEDNTRDFKKSSSSKHFQEVENLFEQSKNAGDKNKLTNDFLTSWAIVVRGEKLSSRFSEQRKWLTELYEAKLGSYEHKTTLVKYMGHYARFYRLFWVELKADKNNELYRLVRDYPDGEIAFILLLFLKENNHKMAITVLAQFYIPILQAEDATLPTLEFIKAIKAIGAFYILWRAAESNTGLDVRYRQFFEQGEGKCGLAWFNRLQGAEPISLEQLKAHFSQAVLQHLSRGEDSSDYTRAKERWARKAAEEVSYSNAKPMSRLFLFMAAHNTIPDPAHPGLIKRGSLGVAPYLSLEHWSSMDNKTIEHIAPQKPQTPHVWDSKLYQGDEESPLIDRLGNLTLLPPSFNTSIGNKPWAARLQYYKIIANPDPEAQREIWVKYLGGEPEDKIWLLQQRFAPHVQAIASLDEDFDWNAELVHKRTERILELVWQQVAPWLLSAEQLSQF